MSTFFASILAIVGFAFSVAAPSATPKAKSCCTTGASCCVTGAACCE